MRNYQLRQVHIDRWIELVEYQKTIKPFPITIDDACKLWKFDDPHGARNTLKRLVDSGYAIRRGCRGKDVLYFAVEPED
jgi:hypothetical protein